MAPLVLKKLNGDEVPLVNLTPLRGIDKAEQKQELLGVDTVSVSVHSNAPISAGIGDAIEVFGGLYTLNQLPGLKREGQARFSYDFTLEGPQCHLLRAVFFDTETAGNALSSTFSLTGNLAFFAQVLLDNITRVVSGWTLGTCTIPGEADELGVVGPPIAGMNTETKTLTFADENCLAVLQRLCTEWGTEFSIGYTAGSTPSFVLNISPAGQALGYTFSYGQGNGLYELSRRGVQQAPFFNRLYVFGSARNLPSNYRGFGTRLQIPLQPRAPTDSYFPWDSKVENTISIGIYGIIESTKVFEEVYPHRTGTVGTVTSKLKFTDPTISFNPFAISGYEVVNGNRIPIYQYKVAGITPKIHFQTGQLAGYDFEVVNFDPTIKTFTIKSFKDERGQEFPDPVDTSPFQIQAGDTYVLLDIRMPDEYVQAAEEQLLAAGMQWLIDNGSPSLEYSLTLDEMYLQGLANDTGPIPISVPPNFFNVGDQIRLVDTELGIDRYARIIGFTRDVIRPYKYTLTLGNAPKDSLLTRILSHQKEVTKVLGNNGLSDPLSQPITPAQSKAEVLTAIATQVRPVAHAANYTFLVKPLPAGYTDLVNKELVRHKFELHAIETSPDFPDKLKAILQASGHKILL